MAWMSSRKLRTTRRITVVNDLQFPAGVRQRLGHQHPEVRDADLGLVEAATRQWFRIVVRRPKTTLAMPSVITDDLWHEFVLHTRDYEDFCQASLGRVLRPGPKLSTMLDDDSTGRSVALTATVELARQDEDCAATDLPLLFRIDQTLGVPGGRRYLADCGGRGQCYGASGMVCLRHLRGPGDRLPPARRGDLRTAHHHQNYAGVTSDGWGFN